MDGYLKEVLGDRHKSPQEDLLSKLAEAEVQGEKLTHSEILGFCQLLLLASSETTINLINNSVLCLLEHPEQFSRLRNNRELPPTTIEEVLRYRSPTTDIERPAACARGVHDRVFLHTLSQPSRGRFHLGTETNAAMDRRRVPSASR